MKLSSQSEGDTPDRFCRGLAPTVCAVRDDRASRRAIRRIVRSTLTSSTRRLLASPGATWLRTNAATRSRCRSQCGIPRQRNVGCLYCTHPAPSGQSAIRARTYRTKALFTRRVTMRRWAVPLVTQRAVIARPRRPATRLGSRQRLPDPCTSPLRRLPRRAM